MFVDCPGIDRHWGPVGAAGLALFSHNGVGDLLLMRRSMASHHGGVWSTPGGALEPSEDPATGAVRETAEELAVDLSGLRYLGQVVDLCEHCTWTYTTVIAAVPGRPPAAPSGWEADDALWIARSEVAAMDLHLGLRRRLDEILAAAECLTE